MNEIQGLSFGSEMGVHTATANKAQDTSPSFSSYFADAVQNAEDTDNQFTVDTQQLLTGDADDLAQVTVNANKAQTALNLVVNLRDKAVDAYREVMQMSL